MPYPCWIEQLCNTHKTTSPDLLFKHYGDDWFEFWASTLYV